MYIKLKLIKLGYESNYIIHKGILIQLNTQSKTKKKKYKKITENSEKRIIGTYFKKCLPLYTNKK